MSALQMWDFDQDEDCITPPRVAVTVGVDVQVKREARFTNNNYMVMGGFTTGRMVVMMFIFT